VRLYLADLGHNQLTKSSDSYPLGVANLATYLRAHLKSDRALDISIFREPEDLKAALDSEAPAVLGLSSYSWNHQLSLSFARYAKRKNPGTITMMGGPNFPLTVGEQESFLRAIPEIDVAVRGPTAEGERAFLQVMQRLVDAGERLEGLLEAPVPGNLWIDRKSGDFVVGSSLPRMENLDEIPSPYLAGLMDPFWSTGYFPLMQIARGCPFSCQFCNSAVSSYSKVYAHSFENLKADLLYAAQRVNRTLPLCFADDNFGMYQLDVEIADLIAWLQDKYGWPNFIRATTGKNRSDRIIQVMRKIRGALPMTSAVQSMSPVVLENIQRSNVKLETYRRIQQEALGQGMQAYGELILSMPGETKDSHLKAISDLMDAGVKRISANQLILEHGAPLNNPDQRERFACKPHFRVVSRNIGDYGTGKPVIEIEEMVADTPTISFDDYLEVRVFHLLLTIFYYEGNFEEAFKYAGEYGIKPFDLLRAAQKQIDHAPEEFQQLIAGFVRETREELFDSHEECLRWAREHFKEVLSGEVGGNLLSKYSMMGRFWVTENSVNFLEAAIRSMLSETAEPDELTAVASYLRTVLLRVPFGETMRRRDVFITNYDIEAWRNGLEGGRLADFRVPSPISWQTGMDPDIQEALERRLATFGEHPATMGKFTRTVFAKDLRRTLLGVSADTGAAESDAVAGGAIAEFGRKRQAGLGYR
jgi:radical SAM superfamily enzyme YgiQ (UPF0313 family)